MLNVTGKGKIFNPKVKFLPSGKALCEFSIGTSRKGKDGKYVNSYFPAKAFGPLAEEIAGMDKVFVTLEGFLGQDEWTDKDTQKQRRKEYIVVMKLMPVESEKTPVGDEDIPF
jgi:single-stranded DNA-binding protein